MPIVRDIKNVLPLYIVNDVDATKSSS